MLSKVWLAASVVAFGKCWGTQMYCVYPDAAVDGDGRDWRQPLRQLPRRLERGALYYCAKGFYGSRIFDDPCDGGTAITLRKANSVDHGPVEGWNDSYGDAPAVFGPLVIKASDYYFDGSTGGGPSSWTNGFGLRVVGLSEGNEYFVRIAAGVRGLRFEHIHFGNERWPTPGCDTCVYAVDGSQDVTFKYCYFVHFGDVGFTVGNAVNWRWELCRVDKVCRLGEKTNCGSGVNHGAGWEFTGAFNKDIWIKNNYITNIEGTGWIGIYGSGAIDGLYVVGNVFENTPDFAGTWGNGIIYNVSGVTGPIKNVKIYNNTFVHLNHYAIVGLSKDSSGSKPNSESFGNEFINNILYELPKVYLDGAQVRSHNASQFVIPGDRFLIFLAESPFLELSSKVLKQPLPGKALGGEFAVDMAGNLRGSDGCWDCGAIEFISPRPNPPLNLRVNR